MDDVYVMVAFDETLAIPKSVTLARPNLSIKMFCGLISLWIIPDAWADFKAWAICTE